MPEKCGIIDCEQPVTMPAIGQPFAVTVDQVQPPATPGIYGMNYCDEHYQEWEQPVVEKIAAIEAGTLCKPCALSSFGWPLPKIPCPHARGVTV